MVINQDGGAPNATNPTNDPIQAPNGGYYLPGVNGSIYTLGMDEANRPKSGLIDFSKISGSINPSATGQLNFGNNPQAIVNANAIGKANSIYDQATTGTLNSFNTAANRLRERITSMNRGQQNQINQKFLGTGFGASGLNNNAKISQNLGSQNVYAQGLNELSNTFEQNRLNGLGIGQGAVNSLFGDQQAADKLNLDSFGTIGKLNLDKSKSVDDYNAGLQKEASRNYTDWLNELMRSLANIQVGKVSNS